MVATHPPPAGSLHQPEGSLVRSLRLLCSHLVVALVALVGIGGATRVMEAGLACPDWPLCYGSLFPGNVFSLQVFLEWFHRLDAFVVGVALLVLTAASVARRRQLPAWLPWASLVTLLLVAVQGALGALTVLELLPAGIVTAHLGTALALVALLSGMQQALGVGSLPGGTATEPASIAPSRNEAPVAMARWWSLLAALTTALVLAQCLLGGAMASQWAAGRCLSEGEACSWLLAHRQLASWAALAVALLAVVTAAAPNSARRALGLASTAAALVLMQMALGILSLRLTLSVPLVTVAHQLTAALLVAVLTALTVKGSLGTAPGTAATPSPPLESCHG